MNNKITKTQTARLLASFIRYTDEKGGIKQSDNEFFLEIGRIIPNGNDLEKYLFELSKKGIINYDEIGEDGFAPIIMASCSRKTAEHLAALLEEIDNDSIDLKRRISEILTFDPERLKFEISDAEDQLKAVRASAEANALLKPLLSQISIIETHFHGVAAVAEKYEDVYKNIIRPVQLEGQSGIKATVRWAIISVVVSTLITVALGNWKDLVEIFKKFC